MTEKDLMKKKKLELVEALIGFYHEEKQEEEAKKTEDKALEDIKKRKLDVAYGISSTVEEEYKALKLFYDTVDDYFPKDFSYHNEEQRVKAYSEIKRLEAKSNKSSSINLYDNFLVNFKTEGLIELYKKYLIKSHILDSRNQ